MDRVRQHAELIASSHAAVLLVYRLPEGTPCMVLTHNGELVYSGVAQHDVRRGTWTGRSPAGVTVDVATLTAIPNAVHVRVNKDSLLTLATDGPLPRTGFPTIILSEVGKAWEAYEAAEAARKAPLPEAY